MAGNESYADGDGLGQPIGTLGRGRLLLDPPKDGCRFGESIPCPQRATEDEPGFAERVRSSVSFPAIGIDRLAELQHYEAATKQEMPLLDGISAEAAEYTRDGRRVVYLSYPQHSLGTRSRLANFPFS